MPGPCHDPSIEHEPHLRPVVHGTDPTEAKAEQLLANEESRASIDDSVEQTVWDEPALSNELVGPSNGPRLTYAEWLDWRISTTPVVRTWLVTLAVVLAAGPWGVLGAIIENTVAGAWGLIGIAVVAPVVEETMKVAIALWVIEKRPYLFRMPFQILLCALAGGLAFAFIENLIYLNVYIPGAAETNGGEYTQAISSPVLTDLATWRWTVCTGLHATCSFFAGLGLIRMWSHAITHHTRPKIAHAAPMIVTAMIGHGLYNGMATIAELSGWPRF